MRDDKVYLGDIIESIELIFSYIDNQSDFEFSQNLLVQDAIYRRFEIIGEATANISESFRTAHPEIEWRLMRAMRNKLSHEYFGISSHTIYNTIQQDLPTLLGKLQNLYISL